MSKINNNGVIRDMTPEEETQLEQDNAQSLVDKENFEANKTADATNKANGNTKLLDLGLTQAEATALTGYTPPSED